MTMGSTEIKRSRGIRRSWLAIGLLTTSLQGAGATIATATIDTHGEQNNSQPSSIWTRTNKEEAALRRHRRTQIAEIRELGSINHNPDFRAMLEDESFELIFREFDRTMSAAPVRKTTALMGLHARNSAIH